MTRSRSLPDGAELDTVLDALRRAGGPIKPSDLAARLRCSVVVLRARVKVLASRGLVELTGKTVSRQIALTLKGANGSGSPAPQPSGRPEPKAQRPGASSSATTPEEALVQARDQAIVHRLKQGRASIEELLAAMPSEPGLSDADKRTACMKAVRRLMMRGRVADVGDKFMLVVGQS